MGKGTRGHGGTGSLENTPAGHSRVSQLAAPPLLERRAMALVPQCGHAAQRTPAMGAPVDHVTQRGHSSKARTGSHAQRVC